jgi:type VI secretion system protein ImpB
VQLKFNSMEDFEPANVAKQVEPLRKLLETRDKLRDLLTKVDRSDDLENVLERVLQNTDELKKLSTELGIRGDAAPSSDNS